MGSDRARYRKYKKICAMIGAKESTITDKIDTLRKTSRTGHIFHKNSKTKLSFYLYVDRIAAGSCMVRLYEDRPDGEKIIMSGEIRTKPPKKSGRSAAGLGAIAGSIIVIAIAAAVGTSFYVSLIDRTVTDLEAIRLDVQDIKIRALLSDAEVDTVHLEMLLTVSQHVPVSIGGDVADAVIFDGAHPYEPYESGVSSVTGQGNGVRIHYSGFVVLEDEKAEGDYVTILIEYGQDTATVSSEVRGL